MADERSPLLALTALDLRDRLASGAVRAVELAGACLAEIARREPEVQAWAWLDGDHAMAQAEALDRRRQSGAAIGPLHGLPVGLKDIIDTRGIPTENGTALDAGRVPTEDAVVVQRLKAAGAVILGKTVTTELAGMAPSKTRNPVNPGHTPGGSSAGSAAAVSAGMAPLALGTQTGGSVIRPAAFCGIVGYKPSFGMIPRTGVLVQAPSLDTLGTFSRSVADAALLAEALWGGDPGDRATGPTAPPRLLQTALSKPPVTPMFGMLTLPGSDAMAAEMAEAMAELGAFLGEQAFDAALPDAFDDAAAIRERINYAELAKCYYSYERRGLDRLSEQTRGLLAEGKAIPARDYLAALDWAEVLNAGLEEILTRCDAMLAPAALGPAPEGLGSTGSAIFNGLFTLTRVPVVTLPLFRAENGLPMGVQVIGRRGDDARLLRSARWLMDQVAEADE